MKKRRNVPDFNYNYYLCVHCGSMKKLRDLSDTPLMETCPKRSDGEPHFWLNRQRMSFQCSERLRQSDKPIDADYCYYMACCYEINSPNQDLEAAVSWYKKAIELGHVDAMITLGHIYEVGDKLPQDIEEAEQLYNKAFDTGDRLGKHCLARVYTKRHETQKALVLYEELAKAKDEPQSITTSDIPFSILSSDIPLWWRRKKPGYPYEDGVDGDEKEWREELEWHQKSAEEGNIYSMIALGNAYSKGKLKDEEKALEYFRKAAIIKCREYCKNHRKELFQMVFNTNL